LDLETSSHRDHHLETALGKISFNLFSNRLRVPCGANIQVLAASLFVIEFRCAHTHLPRARQTRKHCQTGCRRSHIRWESGSFACAPNLRVHDQDHTDSLGVGENQSRRDSVKAQYEVLGNDAKRPISPARDDRNVRLSLACVSAIAGICRSSRPGRILLKTLTQHFVLGYFH
jgi:hypothetical protein